MALAISGIPMLTGDEALADDSAVSVPSVAV